MARFTKQPTVLLHAQATESQPPHQADTPPVPAYPSDAAHSPQGRAAEYHRHQATTSQADGASVRREALRGATNRGRTAVRGDTLAGAYEELMGMVAGIDGGSECGEIRRKETQK